MGDGNAGGGVCGGGGEAYELMGGADGASVHCVELSTGYSPGSGSAAD